MFTLLAGLAAGGTTVILTVRRRRRSGATRCGAIKRTRIETFDDQRFVWHNGEPRAARGGRWSFEEDGRALSVVPEARRDYWSRTFYRPLLIKHDAQTLLAEVRKNEEILEAKI